MKYTLKSKLFVSFAIVFCFTVFNSTDIAADSSGIQQNKHSGLENPKTASQHEKESLSNQSLIEGHRQKYSYRYYPSCSVYYDIHRRLYYYREADNWKIFSSLPSHFEGKLDDYVKIEMNNDKPYLEYDKHVKEYPPEDSRKKKDNMWSKLILFLFYNQASK
jgi:hypothetical protein